MFLTQHGAGIIVFVALFFWDNKKEEEQLAQITRNETLSRLPLRLSTNRIVELVQLRDTSRPVSLSLFCSNTVSNISGLSFYIEVETASLNITSPPLFVVTLLQYYFTY